MRPGVGSQPKIREGSFMDTTFTMIENFIAVNFQILESIAVIIAAIAAIWGINSWRREMKGKREYQLAEETLVLFYEAAERIRFIRAPFSRPDENKPPTTSENSDYDTQDSYGPVNVFFNRYESHRECFDRLHALRFRFKALLGNDNIGPFEEIEAVLNEIRDSVYEFSVTYPDKESRQGKEFIEEKRKLNNVIYAGYGEDIIAQRISSAIAQIENICGPILSKH
jgi:hypothetical protein